MVLNESPSFCSYEEAPLIEGLTKEDVECIEEQRVKLLNLKIKILEIAQQHIEFKIFGKKVWAGIRVFGEPDPPPQPEITSFKADPDKLSLGACTDLSWTFEGTSLTKIQIKRDGKVIFESDPISPGTLQDCPDYTGDIEYRLIVWAVADVKTNERITVKVSE